MHQRQFPAGFLRVLPDDGNRLSRRDVVSGTPVLFARDTVEVLLNDLLSSRQSITPAHQKIMSDSPMT